MFAGDRNSRRPLCVSRVQLLQRVWRRRIGSRFPFAYLSHGSASHAAWAGLGPPPGPARLFSSLNSSVWLPQRSSESSEGPAAESLLSLGPRVLPPLHHHHQGQRKNPSATGRAAETRGRSTPLTKELQDKGRKNKKKRERKTTLPGWPNAGVFVWQHDLWQSLRYCWSQANSLHTESCSQGQTLRQGGRERESWKGGWDRKRREVEGQRDRRKKKKKKKSEGGQSNGRWEVTGIEKMEDQRGKESRQDKRKGERRKDSGRLREMKQGKRGAGWGKPSLQPSENNPTCCNCVISELSRTQTELCTHARKMILEDNEHGWNDAWACRFLLVFRNKDLKDSLGTFLPVQFNLTSVLF